MGGFEPGAGDADAIFEESETDESPDESDIDAEEGVDSAEGSSTEEGPSKAGETIDESESRAKNAEESRDDAGSFGDVLTEDSAIVPLPDLDVEQTYPVRELARSMTAQEYRSDESASRVPFAVWRNGVSHGRSRKTFEVHDDIEALEHNVQDSMEQALGARPPLTDLRELALVYGLVNWESLVEMADEWGLQYDS